jgi:hypothetical protein
MDRTTTKPGRRLVGIASREAVRRSRAVQLAASMDQPSTIAHRLARGRGGSIIGSASAQRRHPAWYIIPVSSACGPDLVAKYLVRIRVRSAANRKSFKAEEYKYGMSSAGKFARASVPTPALATTVSHGRSRRTVSRTRTVAYAAPCPMPVLWPALAPWRPCTPTRIQVGPTAAAGGCCRWVPQHHIYATS